MSLPLPDVQKTPITPQTQSASSSEQKTAPDPQMFTPTTKLVLEQIAESSAHNEICPAEPIAPKRGLSFTNPCPDDPMPVATPLEDQQTTTQLPDVSAIEPLPSDTGFLGPAKKMKQHSKNE